MQYLVLSFSYKKTDLNIREKLSFDDNTKKQFLDFLHAQESLDEAIILCTCNRMEVIMQVYDTPSALQISLDILSQISHIPKNKLEVCMDIFKGYNAIYHIFLVASSLDSLVIGETQISGQLKQAYKYALDNKYCTIKGLGNVIDFAFKCASSVRNQTGISKKPISIASIAVSKAKKLNLQSQKALVIGLGEMGQIAIKHLLNLGYEVTLLNRNITKACNFQQMLGDTRLLVGDFLLLADEINRFELIFSASASPQPIIKKDMIKKTPFKRYFFDLAMPRDIEDIARDDIKLIVIDDLQDIVDENMECRKENLSLAKEIVKDNVDGFFHYMSVLQVEPIIKTLRQFAKESSIKEINKAIQKGFLPESYKNNVEKILHNVFNIFLHTPTKNLKSISSSAQIDEIERTLKFLFSLSDSYLKEATNKHDKNADSMKFK